jgi:hypothetical protein
MKQDVARHGGGPAGSPAGGGRWRISSSGCAFQTAAPLNAGAAARAPPPGRLCQAYYIVPGCADNGDRRFCGPALSCPAALDRITASESCQCPAMTTPGDSYRDRAAGR